MKKCSIPIILTYLAAIYIGASIIYMLFKHRYGTPFRDSLTKEQVKIMKKSKKSRRTLFCISVITIAIILIITRPFKDCCKKCDKQ